LPIGPLRGKCEAGPTCPSEARVGFADRAVEGEMRSMSPSSILLDDLLKKGVEAMRGLDRLNILDIVLGIKGLIEGVVDYS